MNKFFYIASIVLSIVFIGFIVYYADEVSAARTNYYYDTYNPLLPSMSAYGFHTDYASLTEETGLISLFFFAFFITSILLGLIKVKTRTNKVFSIIGLSFSFLILVWNIAMMSNPGAISFDEVAPAWVLYAIILLAFSIVGLVQAVKYGKTRSGERKSDYATGLIDSEI